MPVIFLCLLTLPPQDDVATLPWLSSLPQAQVQAQKARQPILLRVTGEACPWCEKLDAEIAKPEVQKALADWTLVALDISKDEKELKALAVQGIPALRVLTGYGRVMASQDGYLPADKLVAWLKDHRDAATRSFAKELLEEEEVTLHKAIKLVETFKEREAVHRETAIRRLLVYPEVAGHAVVEAMVSGSLQSRLAAFELLQAWKAPIEGVDPWRTDTLTEPRVKALKAWAATPDKKMERPKELAKDQLPSVRHEIEALVKANDIEALGIYERLARYGASLLPEVYAQLKTASSDQQRERLTRLRYRLVCTDALALDWPDGLRRLSSTTAAVRHQAVQELAARATAAEEPLLLELFSDPDGLVREISLRALHQLAGSRVTASLTKLLADPEPNVRAAVLKQLAEQPSAEVVPTIKEYITKEKDADLVVHAVRVLRHSKTKSGAQALQELFSHESWRVRAEAAEGVTELLKDHGQILSEEHKADIYAALIELLKDSDEFVVSRAALGLKSANLLAAVEPMQQAAEKHPELAADIIDTLASGHNTRNKALPFVRKATMHSREPIRVAAVKALGAYELASSEKELKAALKDTGPVKMAACRAVFNRLTGAISNRALGIPDGLPIPEMAMGMLSTLGDGGDESVKQMRARKGMPKWFGDLTPLVTPMLQAATQEEQLAGALVLLALGDELMTPRILKIAQGKPTLLGEASSALLCLPWDKKLKLFHDLTAVPASDDLLDEVVSHFARGGDKRALPVLWEFAGSPRMNTELLGHLYQTLLPFHYSSNYYDTERLTEKQRQAAEKVLKPFAEKGPELRQSLALALLHHGAQDAAAEVAEKLLKDAATPAGLRRDARIIQLMALPKAKAREQAITGLKDTDAGVRRLSLTYLSSEGAQLGGLREGRLNLYNMRQMMMSHGRTTSGEVIVVEPPKGVTAEVLKPLLQDPDAKARALAGYLLCTLGDRAGLPPLLKYWNDHARTDDDWQRFVYRGIAALGDDAQVKYVEEIYNLNRDPAKQYYVPELYWTIRSMEGPHALRLRKQIRQEVGMDRLR